MEFSINSLTNCDIVKINGRVDSYSAPIIRGALESLLRNGHYNIVIDMQNVSYLSSSGILVFLEMHRKLAIKGQGAMFLANLHPTVFSIFEIAGFENVFNFSADLQSAKGRFQN